MLNGQNNFNTGPPGNFPLVGSHGNMQGMQYGMNPGARGPGGMGGTPGSGPPPNTQGRFVPSQAMAPGGGGLQGPQLGAMGGQGALQGGPFSAGPMNGNLGGNAGGLNLGGPSGLAQGNSGPGGRPSMDRTGSGNVLIGNQMGGPGGLQAGAGLQRTQSAMSPARGSGGGGGVMSGGFGGQGIAGQGGGIPRPGGMSSMSGPGGGGGGSGPDLLAMINKQQQGAAGMSNAFGVGIQGNLMGMSGMGSGLGMGGMMGGQEEQTPFDMSEFPSLGGPPPPGRGLGGPPHLNGAGGAGGPGIGLGPSMVGGGGMFSGMDGMGSADGYGVVALQKPHPEFTIQNEDFPALPGAPGGGGGGGGGKQLGDDGKRGSALQNANFPPMSRGGGLGQGPKPGQGLNLGSGYGGPQDDSGVFGGGGPGSQYPPLQTQTQASGAASSQGSGYDGLSMPSVGSFGAMPGAGGGGGGPQSASGTSGDSKVPPKPSAAPDRFGLLGLLSVIRMSDPDLTNLALGTDLTTLGLNLNSPEPLYKTFGSPWADTPPRPELELLLPACYSVQVARCHLGVFQKFQQETLFYIFYSMPGDEAQLYAADELIARGWGFHKELKAWLMRVANTEPVMKTERGERGSFWIFDILSWERVRKDNFNLQYDQLEVRPQVPRGGKDGGRKGDPAASGGAGLLNVSGPAPGGSGSGGGAGGN